MDHGHFGTIPVMMGVIENRCLFNKIHMGYSQEQLSDLVTVYSVSSWDLHLSGVPSLLFWGLRVLSGTQVKKTKQNGPIQVPEPEVLGQENVVF